MKLNLGLLYILIGLSIVACAKENQNSQGNQSKQNIEASNTPPVAETPGSKQTPPVMQEQSSLNSKYYCEEFSIKPPKHRNWRSSALAELNPSKFPKLFETNIENGAASDLLKYCPNYPNLEDEQKKIILIRIVDAMVFFESTCNINARAKGPNGTAYGIFQLHYGREDDYARDCRRYDSKSPIRSIACALDMLHDQIENTQKVFFSGSYWDVLRPRGQAKKAGRIANHIWYYPLCQIPKLMKFR
ncbi:MAG: hypothetical protein JNL11_05100 [Bdellovibrionaceae bacterium]|nr:hypothetical protein [Pseudobdellovibrionaceae bacterium]